MANLNDFFSKSGKKTAETSAPSQKSESKIASVNAPKLYNFDDIYFAIMEYEEDGTGIPVNIVTPYAYDKNSNVLTDLLTNNEINIFNYIAKDGKIYRDKKIKNILTGKDPSALADARQRVREGFDSGEAPLEFYDEALNSREAIIDIMMGASKNSRVGDPYKILDKNPKFFDLDDFAIEKEIAMHTAKTTLPLSAILTQAKNLEYVCNRMDIGAALLDAKTRLKKIRANQKNSHSLANTSPIIGDIVAMGPLPALKIRPVARYNPNNESVK